MNDISAIIGKIEQEAQSFRADALEHAEKNAKAIAQKYAAQAEQETAAAMKAAENTAEAVRQRSASQAGIAGRNALLAARRRVLNSAFDEAEKLLAAKSDAEKTELYARLIARDISADAEVILNSADRAAIGPKVVAAAIEKCKAAGKSFAVSLASDCGSFCGGLILRQGRVELNSTFEVMVAAAREELEAEALQVLFGE